jgi:aldehyde:ferredoxin oxidoreductase
MLEKIAFREGFGNMLAEGTHRTATMIGKEAEELAVTLKGMTWQGGDPRVSTPTVTLGSITNPRGGDDLLSTHALRETMPGWARSMGWNEELYLKWWVSYLDMFPEVKKQIFGSPPNVETLKPNQIHGKAAQVKWYGDLVAVYDSLGECMFSGTYGGVLGPTLLSEMYQAYTGLRMTPRELMRCGERIQNLMRLYINREGITRKQDDLPERFYKEPLFLGAIQGAVAKKEVINRLLDEFYELRGWDRETGIPTREKIDELGLEKFLK